MTESLYLDGAPDVLTVIEVARMARVGRNQVYAEIAAGNLYAARIGKSLRVPLPAYEAWLLGPFASPAAASHLAPDESRPESRRQSGRR